MLKYRNPILVSKVTKVQPVIQNGDMRTAGVAYPERS